MQNTPSAFEDGIFLTNLDDDGMLSTIAAAARTSGIVRVGSVGGVGGGVGVGGASSTWRVAGGRSLSSAATSGAPGPSTTPYVVGDETHFGYERVAVAEKSSRVRSVFSSVAEDYDVMNDLLSAGLHRYWKDELLRVASVERVAAAVRSSKQKSSSSSSSCLSFSMLDVAGGTGDVAFRLAEAAGCVERAKSSGVDPIRATVCDVNTEMLAVGEKRARRRYGDAVLDESKGLVFVEGDAQRLPFPNDSFDLYTIAFGLRNVTDVDEALREARRVLKPGGRFLCLEFSRPPRTLSRSLYDAYSFHVIPCLGEAVANDRASYQYLVESIRRFPAQDELLRRVRDAGLTAASYTNMTEGVVALHQGWKPLD